MSKATLSALLVVLFTITGFLGIFFGSVPLPVADIWEILRGSGQIVHRDILLNLRLPRVLLAALVGGGLGLAGATFQALLRNPLAEPYILGISGGASFGAVLIISFGLAASNSWTLPLAAFAGALLAIFLVFRVAISSGGVMDVRVLLLSGVVIAAFFSACIAFILSISPAQTIQSAVLWTMGSLAGANWARVLIAAVYTIPAGVALIALAKPLNLMAIGEETAYYLGTNVEGVKRISLVIAALITAVSVSVAGVIGFVGLVVPHTVRILVGSDHRGLLPLSFLAGGTFLMTADLVARLALSPIEIPIGVITALIGVPFFLVLLRQSSVRR